MKEAEAAEARQEDHVQTLVATLQQTVGGYLEDGVPLDGVHLVSAALLGDTVWPSVHQVFLDRGEHLCPKLKSKGPTQSLRTVPSTQREPLWPRRSTPRRLKGSSPSLRLARHTKGSQMTCCLCRSMGSNKWSWVKKWYPKCNPGKWKHGLKPAELWWFSFDPYPNGF